MKKQERLESLDALRGFDMFFIVGGSVFIADLANLFPSGFSTFVSGQMHHVDWHGFAFYDMIFPLFLFIAGVSFPYSLATSRKKGLSNKKILMTLVKRAFKLILLGLLINGFMKLDFVKFSDGSINLDFGGTRFASVLGRIGIAWMFGAAIYMYLGKKWSIITGVALLIGYYLDRKSVV